MEWLKELLDEELYNQVAEKLGDTKLLKDDGSYIPKQRFDEVNEEKKQYKKQLEERDQQLEDLQKKAKGNEEMEQQIKDLQKQNDETKKEYEERIQQQQFDHQLDKALIGSKAKNPKAVKGLLDTGEIKLEGEELKGLNEQIEKLKESDGYLFEEEVSAKVGDGSNPAGAAKYEGANPFDKENRNLTEQAKIYKQDPKLYEHLKKKAKS